MPAILFYDPDDFAAVAAGTKQPYEPQPYTVWYPNKLMYHGNRSATEVLGGVAYDRTNRKLYIVEPGANTLADAYSPTPVIHVWQITDGGGSLDTTVPTTPSGLTFNDDTKTLSWTASTAGTKKLYYIIYRNVGPHGALTGGYEPVAMAQSNSWVDTKYNSYAPENNSTNTAILANGGSRGPGAYKVMAMDELGYKSALSDSSGDATVPATTPSISAGRYATKQTVALSCNESGIIRYSLDGTTPTLTYSGALTVKPGRTLKYFCDDGVNTEAVKSAVYGWPRKWVGN
jgi:hypothetical protein